MVKGVLLRMRTLSSSLVSAIFALIIVLQIAAQERISPSDAAKHLGKKATVCGQVASTNFAARSKGRPTFLNLDRPYPNHIFTAVIWGENRDQFPNPPEKAYAGKKVCVTGSVTSYQGVPQIVVRGPAQIHVEEKTR